jgi:hypothetical protein
MGTVEFNMGVSPTELSDEDLERFADKVREAKEKLGEYR